MIFADSSYFIGIAREKDRWHNDALRVAKRNSEAFLISAYVRKQVAGDRKNGCGVELFQY